MFNSEQLNDDYELHQCRFGPLMKDELDILIINARLSHPHWYNGLLARIGEGLIALGISLKERNSWTTSSRPFQTYGG